MILKACTCLIVLLTLTLGTIGIAQAHEVRPGYLQIRQVDALNYDLLWKIPAKGDRRLGLYVRLPGYCRSDKATSSFAGGASIERWRSACEGGLEGGAIDGLEATRTDVLARVEHSNGRMFSVETFDAQPLTREIAELRARLEPLVEVTQIKGEGETHPMLSPNDEFADYETWDRSNLNATEVKKPEMLEYEYARSGLKLGLEIEDKLGGNPFKFGMIGNTDAHTALAAVEQENFFGKHSGVEPEPHRWKHVVIEAPDPNFTVLGWRQAASGYAAVWATENTSEAIFEAMKRKETYATTGSRMLVRFFGGWEFEEADDLSRLPAGIGYARGVPMGGDLSNAPEGKAPSFLVAAMKDPCSGNLDRIQIVKGWLDGDGNLQEKVYDVAWSDDRQPGSDGKLPPVGNTVDVANATWINTIGEPELITVWQDPDFDSSLKAFYYTPA